MIKNVYKVARLLALLTAFGSAECYASAARQKEDDITKQSDSDPSLRFNSLRWDFGSVHESDGPVVHRFEFTNVSNEDIAIEYVSATCRCTSPSHSRKTITPGDVGYVDVEYNPTGQEGLFSHNIYVRSSGSPIRHKLVVTGSVLPDLAKFKGEELQEIAPGVAALTNELDFGYIEQGCSASLKVRFRNITANDIQLTFVAESSGHAPPWGEIVFPDTIRICPGCEVQTEFTYRLTEGKNTYGIDRGKIYAVANGKRADSPMRYSATLVDVYQASQDQRPQIVISGFLFDLGNLWRFSTTICPVKIYNTGAAPLFLRWIEADDGLRVSASRNVINPGETVRIRVWADPSVMGLGEYNGSVRIITNDPVSPLAEISFIAKVL